ncbi:MAG: aldehyde dehydrogenase family protein, partial [Chlamydiia bacterium]|nr:aldehyde dehydrogenase family protein [Chlamydiia bacterium]
CMIAGQPVLHASGLWDGFDPSRPGYVPYQYSLATEEDAEAALACAVKAQEGWAKTTPQHRSDLAARLAQILRERRADFIGDMVLDGGKTVPEADAELSEAIDFAEYYRRSLFEWQAMQGVQWKPKGTILVTPPWNFPCAIPLGGAVAALLTGNTVLFKPAQETVLVGSMVAQALWDAGFPKEALQLIVCDDEPVGTRLIQDPRVNAVILTGGTATARLFLKLRPGIDLMAETGGKNAIIGTSMSDRDLLIKDLVQSAFGHAGQKCSAASLAVLEAEVYDDPRFMEQLREAAASWAVGSAWEPKTKVNPLILPPGETLLRGLTELEEG